MTTRSKTNTITQIFIIFLTKSSYLTCKTEKIHTFKRPRWISHFHFHLKILSLSKLLYIINYKKSTDIFIFWICNLIFVLNNLNTYQSNKNPHKYIFKLLYEFKVLKCVRFWEKICVVWLDLVLL